MAFGLPDLVVSLAANTGKLKKGLSQGQSMLSGFASAAKSIMTGVGIATGLATVAVYGLSSRISKLAGIADEATKTGLSGEFLQQLRFAADQSGVSVETLTGAAKKLTIAIGNGSQGFADLGLKLSDLQAMNPEQQFLAVAQKISAIPTAAGRAAAAMKVFGKSGVEMTGLFAGGMKDLNALMQEARDRGLIVTEADLKRAATADDAIQKMKMSFGALIDKVAVSFAPALESVANKISDWMTPVNKFMDRFNEMPDKFEWAGQTLAAAFDVGMETIKEHWSQMLEDMWDATKEKLSKPIARLNPFQVNPNDNMNLRERMQQAGIGVGNRGLAGAKQRLAAQMAQLKNAPDLAYLERLQNMPDPVAGPVMRLKGKGSGDFAGLAAMIGDKLAEPLAAAKMAGQGMIDRTKMNLSWGGDMLKNMFTGGGPIEAETKRAFSPRLAGAMEAGQADAYSAIAQSMLRGTQDPVVKATEKQTKELSRNLKPMPPVFKMISEFIGGM